jgi:hypothetical protein
MGSDFSNSGRQSDPDGHEKPAADALALTADRKAPTIIFDGDHLERIEILLDLGTLEALCGGFQAAVRCLAQLWPAHSGDGWGGLRTSGTAIALYGCVFRLSRPSIPGEAGRPFRSKATGESERSDADH